MDDACFIKQTNDEISSLDKSILELKNLFNGNLSVEYKFTLQQKINELEETKKSLFEFLERYAPKQKQNLIKINQTDMNQQNQIHPCKITKIASKDLAFSLIDAQAEWDSRKKANVKYQWKQKHDPESIQRCSAKGERKEDFRLSTKSNLPVFCLADSKNLLTNNIKISQFKDFIAFDYGIQINLGTIFCNSSEKEFKKFVSSAPCLHENKKTLNRHNASQIYSAIKTLTDNIGKPIVIAVGKGMGGGLELRKIIGPYKFVESGIKTKSGNLCYFHQFPTEFIRKLTPEESQKVSNARKYQFSLVWNVEIVI